MLNLFRGKSFYSKKILISKIDNIFLINKYNYYKKHIKNINVLVGENISSNGDFFYIHTYLYTIKLFLNSVFIDLKIHNIHNYLGILTSF